MSLYGRYSPFGSGNAIKCFLERQGYCLQFIYSMAMAEVRHPERGICSEEKRSAMLRIDLQAEHHLAARGKDYRVQVLPLPIKKAWTSTKDGIGRYRLLVGYIGITASPPRWKAFLRYHQRTPS